MSRIQKLSDQVTNMIAAGEVVERPMGVVKELVENSMDAGAKDIEIRITDGGLKSISVQDDGCGMDPADAVNSLGRHATSKIARADDLWNIRTMGFRGEALPSIASVSRLDLLTNDGSQGTEVKVEYGKITYAGPQAAPEGTLVTVESLFYRTPARLKHMKSPQSEAGAVIELAERFAFAREDIAFRLYSNDVLRLETTGGGDLMEVLYRVYGARMAESAVAAEFHDYDFACRALLVMPEFTRASRQDILICVNDRVVHSYKIQKALIRAYEPYHAPQRYPICVLKIKTDPRLVDVNVHPSKWEIRLSKEEQLTQLVENHVRRALAENFRLRGMPSFSAPEEAPKKAASAVPACGKESVRMQQTFDALPEMQEAAAVREKELPEREIFPQEEETAEEQPVIRGRKLPDLRVIGQFHADYILAEGKDGLYIIDQHAAQERMNYERLWKQFSAGGGAVQPLLVPLSLKLTPSRAAQAEGLKEYFRQIGLSIETPGDNTVVLQEVPVWMTDLDVEAALQELIDQYDPAHPTSRADLQKHAVATMACHSSIRFNRTLSLGEMEKVIEDLNACEQPYNCPHGRPTIIRITDEDLRKEFDRG